MQIIVTYLDLKYVDQDELGGNTHQPAQLLVSEHDNQAPALHHDPNAVDHQPAQQRDTDLDYGSPRTVQQNHQECHSPQPALYLPEYDSPEPNTQQHEISDYGIFPPAQQHSPTSSSTGYDSTTAGPPLTLHG